MNLTYPHSPDAEWRIAVSRRFNIPSADSAYRSMILPVLESEGLLLECSYASDSVEEHDFWMNRVDLILELADIHILVDIQRSPNMEFEFERSARISRVGRARALTRIVDWSPIDQGAITGAGRLPRPITIVVKEGTRKDKLVPRRLKAILYLSAQTSATDFAERLRTTIHWAKVLKLERLDRVDFRLDRAELKPALIRMTDLAKRIMDGEKIDNLRSANDELATGGRNFVNEAFKWRVDLKNGNVKIPSTFRDTYAMLRNHSADAIGSLFSPGLVEYWPMRLLIAISSFLMSIKVRRRHPQLNRVQPRHRKASRLDGGPHQ